MASVYKRNYRTPDGKPRTAGIYTVEAKIGGRFHRLPGYRDVKATEELGRKIERLASLRESGEQPDAALRAFRDGLSGKLRDKLAKLGIIDGVALESQRSLAVHVAAFREYLTDRGATADHVRLTCNRVESIIAGIGAKSVRDVKAAGVARYLAERRAMPRDKDGLSVKSSNHYVAAFKSFCTWMVATDRVAQNPVAGMDKLNAATDRRHIRRPLETDEIERLLAAARSGADRLGMTGEARFWLYRLAVETGLRANELRTLTRAAFNLAGDAPTVTVSAANSKNRKAATIPLRAETATELGEFLKGKLPAASVFALPKPEKLVLLLRGDLANARAAWVSEAQTDAERATRDESDYLRYRDSVNRVADFHSLRGAFATMLLRSGVDIRTAKELMRHSTIAMTGDIYAVTMRGSLESAVAKLPSFSGAIRATIAATGTDDIRAVESTGGNTGVQTGVRTAHVRVSSGASMRENDCGIPILSSDEFTEKTSDFRMSLGEFGDARREEKAAPLTGVEPVSPG